MTLIQSLSSRDYKIYDVEEGVMAMKDTNENKLYYFPATSDISPDAIKSRPTHHFEDIEEFFEHND